MVARRVGTPLDAALIDRLDAAAAAEGLGRHRMPTVGHDAGMFAQAVHEDDQVRAQVLAQAEADRSTQR